MRTANRLITPSQLALFSRSPVLGSWWEELAAEKLFTEQRPEVTSLDELLFASGLEHEEVLLADLEASGVDVHRQQPVDPDGPPKEQDYANTLAAMREGRQFIHQAALRNDEIRGWADLLERVDDMPSVLGNWSYRPIECKLSSHPKPIYLVQACAYCELLEPLLGHRPKQFRLYLGGRRFRCYSTSAFWAWYEQLRQRYRDFRASFDPSLEPDDEPGDHGLWTAFIDQRLEEKKDLILVAGMRRTQRAKLRDAGIHTIDELAALGPCSVVSGLDPEILDRLRAQAEIQIYLSISRSAAWEPCLGLMRAMCGSTWRATPIRSPAASSNTSSGCASTTRGALIFNSKLGGPMTGRQKRPPSKAWSTGSRSAGSAIRICTSTTTRVTRKPLSAPWPRTIRAVKA
jgi:predicted RecB family nuclease